MKGERGNANLVLAERPIAAPAALHAARSTRTACPLRLRAAAKVLAAPFGNRARPAADQPLHAPAALGTSPQRRLRHLLPPFKTAPARIAKIIVGRHQQLPF